MILPPHVHVKMNPKYEEFITLLNKLRIDINVLSVSNRTLNHGLYEINNQKPYGEKVLELFAQSNVLDEEPEVNINLAAHQFALLRHDLAGGRFFEIDASLNTLLEHTDIGKSCPNSFLRLPYPDVYFFFPQSTSIQVLTDTTGTKHYLSGIYARDISLQPDLPEFKEVNKRYGATNRGIELICSLSHINKHGLHIPSDYTYASGTHWIPEKFENESIDYTTSEKERMIIEAEGQEFKGKREHVLVAESIISHLAKCLIFMATPDAILDEKNDRDELVDRLNRLKKKKSTKNLRKLEKTFNRIIVKYNGDTEHVGRHDTGNKKGIRSHWRRGHFKGVRYGKNRSEIKSVFIKPTLINKESVKGVLPTDYLLKK